MTSLKPFSRNTTRSRRSRRFRCFFSRQLPTGSSWRHHIRCLCSVDPYGFPRKIWLFYVKLFSRYTTASLCDGRTNDERRTLAHQLVELGKMRRHSTLQYRQTISQIQCVFLAAIDGDLASNRDRIIAPLLLRNSLLCSAIHSHVYKAMVTCAILACITFELPAILAACCNSAHVTSLK